MFYLKGYRSLKKKLAEATLGRRYWRNRAQKLEQDLIRQPMIEDLIKERDQYREESKRLSLAFADTVNSVRWFEEAKKAYKETEEWKQKYYQLLRNQ